MTGSASFDFPLCSKRNPCFTPGYSLTSCSTPSFDSADSSRCGRPRIIRSAPPYDATIGHAPSSRVAAFRGTSP